MKKVLLDASSAILLLKADLLSKLLDIYSVSQTQSVLHELTRENHFGTETFRQLAARNKITVIDVQNTTLPIKAHRTRHALGRGEFDTIKCFEAGSHDFIIVDDGKAARYCTKKSLAFINALLFPRVLFLNNNISQEECNAYMDKIIRHGRYSGKVIAWAQNCKKASLLFAFPDDGGIDIS
jgi:predicted nucleic acid-binding protein